MILSSRDERLSTRLLGMQQYFAGRSSLDDDTLVHEGNLGSHFLRKPQFVGHNNHGHPFGRKITHNS